MRALAVVALSAGLIGPLCSASAQAPNVVAPAPGLTPASPPAASPNPAPPAAASPNPAPPQAAAAPPRTAPTGPVLYTYKVDAWDAAAYANPGTTTLAFCAASAEYQNGIKLGFVLNSQFEWGIVLIDPAWNLTYNASYPIEMAVDTRASGAATAHATGTAEVLVSLKPNVALFKDFMEGERLGIKTAGGTYTFNLTNTAEMLPSLVKCAERYVGPIPASANPFAGN
jgi:hypothetical protein